VTLAKLNKRNHHFTLSSIFCEQESWLLGDRTSAYIQPKSIYTSDRFVFLLVIAKCYCAWQMLRWW
jgi:hypothetical protein